jgi:hypothetical protein
MCTSGLRLPEIRKTVIITVLVLLSFVVPTSKGQIQQENQRYSIVLQGSSLQDALQQFISATSGTVSISWDPLLVSGKRAFCVTENATIDEMLTCILKGTGLDFVIRSNGLYVLGLATEGPANFGNLRGIILDYDTEQPVPNATIYLAEAGRGMVANQEGMFIFPKLLPGTYSMRVQHIGYRTRQSVIEIGAGEDASTEVILESQTILITTPLVIDGLMQPSSMLLGAPTASQEEVVQNLASGTSGLLQTLDAMPGVRVNDATADIHIQGGEAGEHQFRLDGAPVFLPLNVASFIGPFSPFALGKITVHKAGFSARLGSQISGIVAAEHDLRAPTGSRSNRAGHQLTFQVDPLSTNGRFSGFWSNSSGRHVTVLGSARIGTWSLLAPPSLSRLMDEWNTIDTFLLSAFAEQNTPFANLPSSGEPAIQFSDVHAASKVRFGALKTLNTSAYWGRSSLGTSLANLDLLGGSDEIASPFGRFEDLYSWQTGMAQTRLDVVQSPHVLSSIGLKSSFYKLSHNFDVPDQLSGNTVEDDGNRVFELTLDGSMNYFTDSGREYELGAEATVTGSKFTVAGTQQFPLQHESSGWRVAVFGENKIHIGQNTVVEAGLRTTWLASRQSLYAEPRLAARMDWLKTSVGDVSLFLASGLYRQFVSQFDISSRSPRTFVSSTRFWMGNDATVTPPKAAHFTAEVLLNPNETWSVSAESFYKHQYHILSVDYSASDPTVQREMAQDEFLKASKGHTYGLSGSVKRMLGPGNIKVRGDHTVAERRISSLYGDQSLSVPWSEPFRLEVSTDIVPARGVVLLMRWRGSWGRTWGFRKAYYDFLSAHLNDVDMILEEMRENGVSSDAINRIKRQITNYDLTSPDSHTLPPVYQLDLSGSYSMRIGKYALQLRADVINVLNRDNVSEWRFQLDEETYFGNGSGSTTGLLERSDRHLLPRVISAAVRLTW